MKSKIIYSLVTEDVQTVAIQLLDRPLSKDEIELLIDSIAEKIKWYDVIEDAIIEKIGIPNE